MVELGGRLWAMGGDVDFASGMPPAVPEGLDIYCKDLRFCFGNCNDGFWVDTLHFGS